MVKSEKSRVPNYIGAIKNGELERKRREFVKSLLEDEYCLCIGKTGLLLTVPKNQVSEFCEKVTKC